MHESEARVDEHGRAVDSSRAHRAPRSGQRRMSEVLPGMAVVQQTVRLLSGKVEVDASVCARHRLPREDPTEFGTRAGDRYVHGFGSTLGSPIAQR